MCIGGSSEDWLGGQAGGIAYVGVTAAGCSWCSYCWPAFVFPAQLGGGWPKYVWEAVSHELGHNFGLWHDGAGAEPYYAGGCCAGSVGLGWGCLCGCMHSAELGSCARQHSLGSMQRAVRWRQCSAEWCQCSAAGGAS